MGNPFRAPITSIPPFHEIRSREGGLVISYLAYRSRGFNGVLGERSPRKNVFDLTVVREAVRAIPLVLIIVSKLLFGVLAPVQLGQVFVVR